MADGDEIFSNSKVKLLIYLKQLLMKDKFIWFGTFVYIAGNNMAFLRAKKLLHLLTKPFTHIRLGHLRNNRQRNIIHVNST